MSVKLTPQHVEAIEKAINKGGRAEASVKVEDGRVLVLSIEKKKMM